MQRAMIGFHRDDEGDWVAELSCGHAQHIRHDPPFWNAAWIEDDDERARRLGEPLECPLCDEGGESACFAHLLDESEMY